jgi:hypothetical protein
MLRHWQWPLRWVSHCQLASFVFRVASDLAAEKTLAMARRETES